MDGSSRQGAFVRPIGSAERPSRTDDAAPTCSSVHIESRRGESGAQPWRRLVSGREPVEKPETAVGVRNAPVENPADGRSKRAQNATGRDRKRTKRKTSGDLSTRKSSNRRISRRFSTRFSTEAKKQVWHKTAIPRAFCGSEERTFDAARAMGWDGCPLVACRRGEKEWCRGPDSNWGHPPFQGGALPTELPRRQERKNTHFRTRKSSRSHGAIRETASAIAPGTRWPDFQVRPGADMNKRAADLYLITG